MRLPGPRGPLSAAVIDALRRQDPRRLRGVEVPAATDPLGDDDLQLALWVSYELHYQGFDDVPDTWEWQPELIALRGDAEQVLLDALRAEVTVTVDELPMGEQLQAMISADEGPPLSRFMQREASREQFTEFAIHRSVYQLKEADPHTWAIPRLSGRPKAALVEIQTGEYGDGAVAGMHSELYRDLLTELGLDAGYGAYVDTVPGITLAISNVISLFGLRRELRGAVLGHLAAYEMTSSEPCRRYARGLRRLGGTDRACAFYDVHVTADALHEQLAVHDLCGALAVAEPHLQQDILFGAASCLYVDNRFAGFVLSRWSEGRSSLRQSFPVS